MHPRIDSGSDSAGRSRAPRLALAALGLLAALGYASTSAYAARAYVSNEDGESVTVIDTAKGEVVATVPVGKRPRGLKLSHDGASLYVAVSGLPKCPPSTPDEECAKLKRDLEADGVVVIDTRALKVNKVLKGGSDPEQFDISRDGRHLFISNEDSARISVLDVVSGALVSQIPVGHEPEGVRLSPDGRWVLVTNETDNTVSVIDAQQLKVAKTINVGARPRDVAFTPDSATAYVSGESDASVYRLTLSGSGSATRLVQLRKEDRPMGVLLDAGRQRLYVSTGRGGTVAVISLQGPKVEAEVQVGTRPWGIALTRDGRFLYTANGPSNDVSVVDTASLTVVKKIPVGRGPWGVALDR